MVQTRSFSKKNTSDTNIEEVNRDVTEASNKNTTIQTAQNSIMKPIKASKKTGKKKVVSASESEGKVTKRPHTEEDLARVAFMLQYRREYLEKHPDADRLPDEERKAGNEKFGQLVKELNSKIIEEYLEKYTFEEVGEAVCWKYMLQGKRPFRPSEYGEL